MALRERRARDPRPRGGGVSTHRIQRSLRNLTVGLQLGAEERKAQKSQLEATETEQQYKIDLAGTAGVRVAWDVISVSFDNDFYPATDRRDSTFNEPHFRVGSEMKSDTPVILSAAVKGWHRNNDGVVGGADLWVGAHAPGVKRTVKFRAVLHVVFQGYAQPYVEDDDEVS